MNKKIFVKRVIGLSLLSGMFIPVLASAESYTVKVRGYLICYR